MDIKGEEANVSGDNSVDLLIKVVTGSNCIYNSIQAPAENDVTQQKGKHYYQYYKLLFVSRKLMFQ
jgi:protein-disulfide isomerase